MVAPDGPLVRRRSRLAWWLVGLAAAGVFALFVTSFVGTFALGLFIYYMARPVHRALLARLSSRGLVATLTVTVIVLPALALLGYVVLLAFREFAVVAGADLTAAVARRLLGDSATVEAVLAHPTDYLLRMGLAELRRRLFTLLGQVGVVTTGLLHLTLAVSFAFFCFRDGGRLERWFRSEFGGEETAAYAFLRAMDRDLEAVYFGNVITVLLTVVAAAVVYNGFNALTRPALSVPFPTLLALLTGLATFVPLVVGKIVYVPVTVHLGVQAARLDGGLFVFPAAFLAVCFLFLDLLPQTFVQPVISGRTLHTGMMLFSYVLGTALFGWYGLFLGPLLVVFVVQFANVVLPELARGERVTAATAAYVDIGSDPPDADHLDGTGEAGDDGTAEEGDDDGSDGEA
jgi:predicted PurR-regulated permease PerM